ncbi:phosphoglycerate mutase [Pseudoxanthomonas kalamensis DSM 18571]|uniref:SixA phosphatase family protein n=1 Tax=Pseudoxanthomonas kalamensis TaxID=289483 RepID=UPI0013917B1E|nr:histidine phosphatase family protein [Pseudoxanthomonas kalamensis]KAF1712267.1 phosphoglycerate mutase [Pseudoxanthomonas kalamensis DSM 18571]
MRELILLRHAHAEPSAPGQADIDRPLSAHGLGEARAAAAWLAEHRWHPDRVLCSPARRTRETLSALQEAIPGLDCQLEESIYEASPGDLATLADRHREVERLLMVGHNPGFEQLAALLYSGQSGDYRGMPPAAVAVLSLPADAVIEPGIAKLAAFWWP